MIEISDSLRFQWLWDNQGKYQIIPDNSKWYRENGEEFINKFSMAYKGTQVSCMSLPEAIDYFIKLDSSKEK